MSERNSDNIREKVRERYSSIAVTDGAGCGCAPSCCSKPAPGSKKQSAKLGYSASELDTVPDGANMGLGCGNPQAIAMLKKGETVLDLGCGGGFDTAPLHQAVQKDCRKDLMPVQRRSTLISEKKGGNPRQTSGQNPAAGASP